MNIDNSQNSIRILSLEDTKSDFEIIRKNLLKAGFDIEISQVENAPDFSKAIQSQPFDIILVDYNLPSFDAVGAIKLCNQFCHDTPVICVSGAIGEIKAIEILKLGAVDYVPKDRLERLPFSLKRALEESREKKNRKLAEEALIKSENRLKDIIFSIAEWVWEIDQNWDYTYSSQQGTELIELMQEEIIGKKPFDFMSEEEAIRVSQIFTEIVKNKAPIIDLENWIVGKNNKKICILTNGMPIFDKQGNCIGYRGVNKDITERKLSEEILKQSENELNFAQQIARMGSWTIDLKSNKMKWSKNMYLLLGYEPNTFEPEYSLFTKLLHPDDSKIIEEQFRIITEKKTGVSFDFRYILENGNTVWVQNNIIPVFDGNNLVKLSGVNIDITDKKRVEQELIKAKENAEASDKLKTAFLNNISHEIRTPLNGILGFAQIIADQGFPLDEKAIYYKMLNNCSDRLLNTVTNFIDISILSSGNQQVFLSDCYPKQLIEWTAAKLKEQCDDKDLVLEIVESELPVEFKFNCDEILLGKILNQLIDNAIKFTDSGQISVGYYVVNNEIFFFVKDSGIGVSEEYKNRIFKNFDQEENMDHRKYEGTGIGLAIAKGLVELLGGYIWAESEKGKGSTFSFSIPLK